MSMKSAIENSTLSTKLNEIKDGATGSFDSTKDSLYHKRLMIGEKSDLPRSDMQASLMSRIENIQLLLQNNPQLAHNFGVDRENKELTFTDVIELNCLELDGSYLYIGFATSPGKLKKIDLTDFSLVSTLTLESGENYCSGMCLDENYLYVITETNPAKIVRINKSDFTRKDVLALQTGENGGLCIEQDGNYIYAGLNLDPAKIVRINKSDFTRKDVLTLNVGEYTCYDFVLDRYFLYVSLESNHVVKIKLSDFTRVASLSITMSYIETDGLYLYASEDRTPTRISKIDLSTFEKVDEFDFLTNEGDCYNATIDGKNFLFSISSKKNIPYAAKLNITDLLTFSRADSINFGNALPNNGDVVTDGTYIYCGFYLTTEAKIYRRYLYPSVSLLQEKVNKLGGHNTSPLIYTRPDRAVRIALTAGASWAYGSYVQVIATNNITTPFKVIGVEASDMTADKEYQIGIGTGTAASEVLKQEMPFKSGVATDSRTLMFDMNTVPEIPANTRVAAKCACETDSLTCGVKLIIATKY